MQRVLEADRYIFGLINNKWNNSFFDSLMPLLRNSNFWLPLYLFLLIFALMNIRKSGWFILLTICTAALTDILSSHIIKNHIFRLRPCHDTNLIGTIRVLVSYCPQSSSFTSSHAANHFGLATFASITLYPYAGKWIFLTFMWAYSSITVLPRPTGQRVAYGLPLRAYRMWNPRKRRVVIRHWSINAPY